MENEIKLTAVYGRVSSANQENEGTIETQLSAIREYAHGQGLIIVREYTDEGWSGDSLDRPSLDQLRIDANKNLWQAVLLYDPDRLARRYSYQELITDELREKGIDVMYVTTPAPKNGVEKILFGVQGLFAEYERAKIAERFRLGKIRKAREGNIIASEAPFGYTFIPKKGKRGDDNFHDSHYEINDRESNIIKQIFSWIGNDHLTIRRIVRELQKQGIFPRKSKRGVWSTSTLSTLLRNKTYIGEGHFGASVAIVPKKPLKAKGYRKIKKTSRYMKPESEWIKIPTPKLIDENLFRRVQEQLRTNFELCIRNRKNEYLLAGKVWCNCSRRRSGEGPQNGKYLYYRCNDRIQNFPLPPTCREKGVNARIADNLIWQKLVDLMTNPEFLYKMAIKWTEKKQVALSEFVIDTAVVNKEVKKLKQQEERYIKAYGMSVLTMEQFQKVILPLREKISAMDTQIIDLNNDKKINSPDPLPEEKEVKEFAEHADKYITQLDFLTKKRIIEIIIQKVIGNDKKLLVIGVLPLSLNLNNVSLRINDRHGQNTTRHSSHPCVETTKEIPFDFQILLKRE